MEVAKALGAMGGKWDRRAQGFVFDQDPTETIEYALITGEVVLPKDWGFFPTPAWLAKQLVEIADIRPDMTVLEPSAGNGALLTEIVKRTEQVRFTELNPDCRTRLALNYGSHRMLIEPDFLKVPVSSMFDRVVMNPPFARQQDIEHVSHAFNMLVPGGKLVSVMAAGVAFRQDKKAIVFRAFVDRLGGEITPLPEDSFAESGTNVRTVIAILPKAAAA